MKNKDAVIAALQNEKYRDLKDVFNCTCCLFHYTATPCIGGIDCASGIKLFMEAEIGVIKRGKK